MALINCRKCQRRVSSEAKLCPACGARVSELPAIPRVSKKVKKLALWSFGLLAFCGIFVGIVLQNKALLAASEAPKLLAMKNACESEWAHSKQRKLKDPNSLQWDAAPAEKGVYQGRPAIFVRYRAINSYGGFTQQQAVCEIAPETGKVLGVLD